jgi:hypothetical protein
VAADETHGAADEIRGAAQGDAPVPLSVLDLVTVGAGRTASDALRTSPASRNTEASTATGSPSTTPCRASPPRPRP